VWTSGRFVNMLDEKDILVCVHTKNILWAWRCFRYVKVPSSPYKRGREGTCKRIQIFWNLCYLQRELQSRCALALYLNVIRTLSRVRVVIRIFRVTPQHFSHLPQIQRPQRSRARGGRQAGGESPPSPPIRRRQQLFLFNLIDQGHQLTLIWLFLLICARVVHLCLNFSVSECFCKSIVCLTSIVRFPRLEPEPN
jgi:hypothetical protein